MLSLYYQGQKWIIYLNCNSVWFSKIWLNLLANVHIYQQLLPCFFHVTPYNLRAAYFLTGHLICAVTATLLNFVRMFRKAHDENCKQAELEKKKVQKEVDMEKAKGINLTKKSGK